MRKMYFSPYTQPFCPVKSAPWNESSHQDLYIGDYADDANRSGKAGRGPGIEVNRLRDLENFLFSSNHRINDQ